LFPTRPAFFNDIRQLLNFQSMLVPEHRLLLQVRCEQKAVKIQRDVLGKERFGRYRILSKMNTNSFLWLLLPIGPLLI
jgi:hypothetical protein